MKRMYHVGNESYLLKEIALLAHSGVKQAVYLNQLMQQLMVETLSDFLKRVGYIV